MNNDLFMMVMEAEGDLVEPFDAGPADTGTNPTEDDQSSSQGVQPATDDIDGPPPLSEGDDIAFDDGSDESIGGDVDSMNDEDVENEGDQKLSEKANNILNQQLYQKMLNRNSEIEEIINNLQVLSPTLPYDIVKSNDEHLTKLKSALSTGKSYVIDKFINLKYGENLMFYQKLDSLYVLLLDAIDTNLKQVDN